MTSGDSREILSVSGNVRGVDRDSGLLDPRHLQLHVLQLCPKIVIVRCEPVRILDPLLNLFVVLMVVEHQRILLFEDVIQREGKERRVPESVPGIHAIDVDRCTPAIGVIEDVPSEWETIMERHRRTRSSADSLSRARRSGRSGRYPGCARCEDRERTRRSRAVFRV
jgi:hypothetical protein